MSSKNKKASNIGNAVDRLFDLSRQLVEEGYTLTGAVYVVAMKGGASQSATKHVTTDGRMGVLRLLPPNNVAPGNLNSPPVTPVMQMPLNLKPDQAAQVLVASSLNSAPTGNVCANCHSSDLRRSGTCETCQQCGSTTGCG